MGLLAAVIVAGMASIRWVHAVVTYRAFGLDPSDEAWYIATALDPSSPISRPSNFGHYLHRLLSLTGGSIGSFRLSGLVLLLGGAGVAAWGMSRWLPIDLPTRTRRFATGGLWCVVANSTVCFYAPWLLTPGYNLLALSMSLVTTGGLLAGVRALEGPAKHRLWPSPNMGLVLAGWSIVVLADIKGPAGAAVALVVAGIVLTCVGTVDFGRAAAQLAAGLTIGLLTMLAVVGSPLESARAISRYSQMASIGAIYTPGTVLDLRLLLDAGAPWLAGFVLVSGVLAIAWRFVTDPQARTVIVTGLAVLSAAALWHDRPVGGADALAGSSGWWWIRSVSWTLLFLTALAPGASRRLLAIGPLVALAALATAFGSNNGVVHQTALTPAVLVTGVLVQSILVGRPPGSVGRALPAAVFALTVGLVSILQLPEALESPYRQPGPIGTNITPVIVGGLGPVQVDSYLSSYLGELKAIGANIPPDARDCLVDLAGGTPIAALALGVRSATNTWVLGGYPRSSEALSFLLTMATCTSGRVVVIDAPHGHLRMRMPEALRSRRAHEIGRAHFRGYLDEVQVVSLLEAADRSARGSRTNR